MVAWRKGTKEHSGHNGKVLCLGLGDGNMGVHVYQSELTKRNPYNLCTYSYDNYTSIKYVSLKKGLGNVKFLSKMLLPIYTHINTYQNSGASHLNNCNIDKLMG